MSVVPVDRRDLGALLDLARKHTPIDDPGRPEVDELLGRYAIDDVANPDDEDVARTPSGEVAADTVTLNIGDVRVSFFTDSGDALKPGDVARQHLASVEVDGLSPARVLRAEFDPIDYGSEDFFRVRLTLLPKEPVLVYRRTEARS